MYLHIGNDFVIDTKNIIGIFNIETTKKKENNKKISVCDEKEKSVILYQKENEIFEYVTNISTTTLLRRINMF